jgi:uncharacterized protein with HEPN domain
MSADSKRTSDFLGHILEAISRIGRYTDQMNIADFQENELVQDAVIRNIEIMGEASKNIERHDPTFVSQNPQVPWALIYAMRNRVSHAYFEVDLKIIWNTTRHDLPDLETKIRELKLQIDV